MLSPAVYSHVKGRYFDCEEFLVNPVNSIKQNTTPTETQAFNARSAGATLVNVHVLHPVFSIFVLHIHTMYNYVCETSVHPSLLQILGCHYLLYNFCSSYMSSELVSLKYHVSICQIVLFKKKKRSFYLADINVRMYVIYHIYIFNISIKMSFYEYNCGYFLVHCRRLTVKCCAPFPIRKDMFRKPLNKAGAKRSADFTFTKAQWAHIQAAIEHLCQYLSNRCWNRLQDPWTHYHYLAYSTQDKQM